MKMNSENTRSEEIAPHSANWMYMEDGKFANFARNRLQKMYECKDFHFIVLIAGVDKRR